MNVKHLLGRRRVTSAFRPGAGRRGALRLERLEARDLLAPTAGLSLTGTTPPPWNQLYDLNNQPTKSNTGYYVGQYAGPGTNPYVALDQGGNINVPYIVNGTPNFVNGTPSFTQPVQTSDWWSSLMLRIDPTQKSNGSGKTFDYAYSNGVLVSEPALLQFQNNRFTDDATPWLQGLGILNPGAIGIDPTPVGPNAITQRVASYTPSNLPLTVGIGGNTTTRDDTSGPEITPLGTANNHPANGTNEDKLNVRVSHYSDWGVQVTYGDGNPDAPINPATGQPTGRNNALTMDLLNGSPFLYFNKFSAGDSTNAYAKVWLRGAGVPGTEPAGPLNVVWGRDLPGVPSNPNAPKLPDNVLAVTLTTNDLDASGALRTSTTSYLVVAPDGTKWSLSKQGNPDGNYHPENPQLWTNPMASGALAVVLLPQFVGSSRFEELSSADQVSVAKLFMQVAGNVPSTNPAVPATVVSDPTKGFNPATGRVNTIYTINTANGQPTYQLLYPHQYNNLFQANQSSFLKFKPTSGRDVGQSVELTYSTLLGEARVYNGNSFTTQLQFQGLLDHLPSLAVQTDAAAARALYDAAEAFMQRYIVDPHYAVGITDNTYDTGLMLLSQTLQAVDALANPNSLLTPQQQQQATLWRDRLLQGLKTELATWFDVSTGRLFQLNTTYDTVIGYPAGYGSDIGINDHHFHYGYFLSAFATAGQFDPGFVQAYLPQIQLLVRDVANFDRTAKDLPFLREFNPWAGHSWADGVGLGGNNEESASESVNFSAALLRLGMLLSNSAWVAQGAYLYQTEIESMNQYWFNEDADPAAGNFGNYPPEFARYLHDGNVEYVTQVGNVSQTGLKRSLFFDSPNYAEAIYAINWLPTASWMLFLGGNQDYLKRNWAQFVQDYQIDGRNGVNEAVVAGYQALLADQGFGLNQPGPTNALLRLDPDQNPAFVATSQTDPGFKGGYLGTNRFVALNWVYALQQLGQVDYSVVADTTSYGVFLKDGQRTFVAANPTAAPLKVTFRDRASGVVIGSFIVQPGQTLTYRPDGSVLSDSSGVAALSRGTSLYLSKPAGQDPNMPSGLTLSKTPGTTNPQPISPANPTQKQILASYAGTYTQVPKRPGDAGNIGNTAPDLLSGIISFGVTGLNGAYNGGATGLQLFLNNALTWKDDPGGTKPFGDQYGPGVVQNDAFGHPTAVIEVRYHFNSNPLDDRVETYTAQLSGVNQFNLYDNLTPASGVIDPNIPRDTSLTLQAGLSQLRPFQSMTNGSVTVRMWQGTWATGDLSHKEFSVSVSADPDLARSSRLVIPFSDGSVGPAVLQLDPPPRGLVSPSQPVNALGVRLSQPALPGTFDASSLTLTLNGKAVPLVGHPVTVTQDAADPTRYVISGLGAFQSQSGPYTLTVNGALIKGGTNPPGSGLETVSWFVDGVGPTLQLSANTPASTTTAPIGVTALFNEPVIGFDLSDVKLTNATASNFRGSGRLYTFDMTPSGPGAQVAVSVAAGAVKDVAGNPAGGASLARTFAAAGPTATISSSTGAVTNLTPIPVTIQFSAAVSGLTVGDLVVRNATVADFPTGTMGTTYSFKLVPTGPGPVTLDVPAGAAVDAQNRPNTAAATLRRVFDPSGPTGVMTSIANYLTYDRTIPVVVLFSEPVTGFDATKIDVTNGTVANFQGSGARYVFDLVADDLGVVTANIAAGAARDAAGNPSAALPTLSRDYRIIPTASVTTTALTPTNAATIPVQIAFNEAMALSTVQTTSNADQPVSSATINVATTAGFAVSGTIEVEVMTSGGMARKDLINYTDKDSSFFKGCTLVSGSGDPTDTLKAGGAVVGTPIQLVNATLVGGPSGITSVGGAVYSFQIAPIPPSPPSAAPSTVSVILLANTAFDAFGNGNPDARLDFKYGATPKVTSLTATQPGAGQFYYNATLTFDQNVKGLDATKIKVVGDNATITDVSGGGAVWNFVLTPKPPGPPNRIYGSTMTIQLEIPDGAIVSEAGIPYKNDPMSPITPITTFTITGPTLVLTSPALAKTANDPMHPIHVTATFSEGVKNFTAGLIGMGNATIQNFTADPMDPAVYTFDLVPNAGYTGNVNAVPSVAGVKTLDDMFEAMNFPSAFNRIVTSPVVTGLTSSVADGEYGVGQQIPIQVTFNARVQVTGTPLLTLNAGTKDAAGLDRHDATASYVSTSADGKTLTFLYTVAPGQASARLDADSNAAISLPAGAAIKDGSGVNLPGDQLNVQAHKDPGSLGANKNIVINTSRTTQVLEVSSPLADGLYGSGQVIPITVRFSRPVVVTGNPDLVLGLTTGTEVANYAGISADGMTLTFTFLVAGNHRSLHLDYASTMALTGGTIKDAAGNPISLLLPAPGTPGSLSYTKALAVSSVAPRILNLSSTSNPGLTYGAGKTISIQVSFDVAVNVTGTPTLALNSGGSATYTGGSGTNQLTFTYTVGNGQSTPALDVQNTSSLTGGTIADQAGNAADRTLPAPRAAGSLSNPSNNRNLKVAAVAPTTLAVFANVNGTRRNGSGFQIFVKFSDSVVLADGPGVPTLALSNGDFAAFSGFVADGKGGTGDRVNPASGGTVKTSNTMIFTYIPANSRVSTKIVGDQPASSATINVASTAGFFPSGILQVTVQPAMGAPLTYRIRYTGITPTTFTGCTLISGNPADTLTNDAAVGNFVTDVSHLDVDYTNPTPLNLAGRTLTDLAGNTVNLTLPAQGQAGSLGVSNRITIKTDPTTAPEVTDVNGPLFQGTFGVGALVPITVTFTEPVTVTGLPQLLLNSGGIARYTGGSGTRVLRFTYLVGAGENAARLDYSGTAALSVPGGTIRNVFGSNADADRTLPSPGAVGSLGYNTRMVIDTATQAVPRVLSVSSPDAAGVYHSGQTIRVQVQFDRAVTVTPSVAGLVPFLQLNAGGTARAVYSSGSGTDTLVFNYTVAIGQSSPSLDYASATALQLNGAKIRDVVDGKDAALALPAPGLAESLRANDLFFIALSLLR